MKTEKEKMMEEKEFNEGLEFIASATPEEKSMLFEHEMYTQGREYAEDGVPYEEIESMGLNNELSFMKGYNEYLEENNIKGR